MAGARPKHHAVRWTRFLQPFAGGEIAARSRVIICYLEGGPAAAEIASWNGKCSRCDGQVGNPSLLKTASPKRRASP